MGTNYCTSNKKHAININEVNYKQGLISTTHITNPVPITINGRLLPYRNLNLSLHVYNNHTFYNILYICISTIIRCFNWVHSRN